MRYLTKEWYIACQADPMTPEVQKQLDEIDRAYCAAQTRETLPDGLLQQFFFHDGVVREIITGTDLTLRIDSPYSEYHTVTFRGARLKQEPPRVGAVWLYRELYRHKSGMGYEVHILFDAPAGPAHQGIRPSDLIDTKIICDEIEICIKNRPGHECVQAATVSGSGSCSMTASWSSSDVCFCTCADISGSCRSCCRANRTPPMAHDMHSTARPRSHTGAECTRAVCAGVAGTAASDVRVVTICSACASESASERTSRRSFCCMRATRRFMTGSRVTASCSTRSATA